MHRSRLFWKLYLGYVALILVTASVVGVLVGQRLEADLLVETRDALHCRALMFRQLVDQDLATVQVRARRLGLETGTRFTYVDTSGTVLADSDQDPARMDEHSRRPEILEAYDLGLGVATRYSATLRTRMMYLAIPVDQGVPGVVRASLPLQEIDRRLNSLRSLVVLGAGIAALVALLVGVFVARRFARPLVALSETASSISQGHYDRRLEVQGRDEMGTFARAFNLMTSQLQQRIETITDDRNKLLAVLTSMVEGVVAVDRDRRVLHMNAVAGEILGSDPERAVGQSIGSITRVQEIVIALGETIQTTVGRQQEIVLPGHPQGRILEIHAAPIRGGEGELAGAVIALHDVTQLRRLEGVRRDFVANVSHEMKTPITVIQGIVETLLDDPAVERDTRTRFLGKVKLQTERLSSIVSDLLTLARVESSHQTIDRSPLDLRDAVRESVQALTAAAESRQVGLEVETPSEPVPVLGDWNSLRLIIDNLLDNAVKYTAPAGSVRLRLLHEGEIAVLEVRDTGIGIEKQHLERIFERFYRVDKARSRDLGGTGLGLSIVKHLVRAHAGEVTVESLPGQGSTFWVRIPVVSFGTDQRDSRRAQRSS